MDGKRGMRVQSNVPGVSVPEAALWQDVTVTLILNGLPVNGRELETRATQGGRIYGNPLYDCKNAEVGNFGDNTCVTADVHKDSRFFFHQIDDLSCKMRRAS